jgi:hypothetical protein
VGILLTVACVMIMIDIDPFGLKQKRIEARLDAIGKLLIDILAELKHHNNPPGRSKPKKNRKP